MHEEKWVTKYYTQSKTWTRQRQWQHTLSLVHNGAFIILPVEGNVDLNVFNPNGNVYANLSSSPPLLSLQYSCAPLQFNGHQWLDTTDVKENDAFLIRL